MAQTFDDFTRSAGCRHPMFNHYLTSCPAGPSWRCRECGRWFYFKYKDQRGVEGMSECETCGYCVAVSEGDDPRIYRYHACFALPPEREAGGRRPQTNLNDMACIYYKKEE